MTPLYECGIDPLVGMAMFSHRERQTMAGIYTHYRKDSLKKAADMAAVFKKKKEAKQGKKAVGAGHSWQSRWSSARRMDS